MMKIVATNVVASRPPEWRPTATPTARAKKKSVDEQIFNSSQLTLITSIICLFELGHANGFNGDIA